MSKESNFGGQLRGPLHDSLLNEYAAEDRTLTADNRRATCDLIRPQSSLESHDRPRSIIDMSRTTGRLPIESSTVSRKKPI